MEHSTTGKKQQFIVSAPKVEQRRDQPTVGIRVQAAMREFPKVIPQLDSEVFRWVRQHGLKPAGPSFIRYYVIDMEGLLDIEIGQPVAEPVEGDDRVKAGVIPAGRYAALVYRGEANGIQGNAALLDWIAEQGLVIDRWDEPGGDAFRSRYESYLTDPANEPDGRKWEIEVAIRLKD